MISVEDQPEFAQRTEFEEFLSQKAIQHHALITEPLYFPCVRMSMSCRILWRYDTSISDFQATNIFSDMCTRRSPDDSLQETILWRTLFECIGRWLEYTTTLVNSIGRVSHRDLLTKRRLLRLGRSSYGTIRMLKVELVEAHRIADVQPKFRGQPGRAGLLST